MNKKGFVLIETLVVTIFTMFIFSVLYNTVVPLLGKYKELSYHDDLDATYDLYYLKEMIINDTNYLSIKGKEYQKITCSNLDDSKCDSLYNFLDIKDKDEVYYINTTDFTNILEDEDVSIDTRTYLKYVDSLSPEFLLLQNDGYVTYLSLVTKPVLSISEEGTLHNNNKDNNYRDQVTITFTCDSVDEIATLEIYDKNNTLLTSTIVEDETNKKSKSFILSTKGVDHVIKGKCTTIYNVHDDEEEKYTIFKYYSNNEDKCGCDDYGTKSCNCTTKYNYGSWGSYGCYTSSQSDTSTKDWECEKDGEGSYCEGSARYKCRSRSKSSYQDCDRCTDYNNCTDAASCWTTK